MYYVLPHLLAMLGFGLALIFIARMVGDDRHPGAKLAWLMAMIIVPYIAVPLYLVFGGRKIRRMASRKAGLPRARPERVRVARARARTETERLIERGGGAPVRSGHRTALVRAGTPAWRMLCDQIEGATHCIHITTFILQPDEVGRELVERLARRARDGVRVYLLLDALGCFRTRGRFVQPLRDAGGHVGSFMPVHPFHTKGNATLRNHRKLMIFDGRRAFIGGMNIGREYLGPTPNPDRWEDAGFLVEGPCVLDCYEVFASDWYFATEEILPDMPADLLHHEDLRVDGPPAEPCPATRDPDGAELQVVASGPDVPTDPLYEAILAAIVGARQRVWLVTPYFIPDEPLLRLLELKARMGTDVRLLVPERSNHLIADLARAPSLRRLMRSQVRVFGYRPRMLHSKLALIDDRLAVAGSANLDVRSLHLNYEISLFLYSAAEVATTEGYMRELLASAMELTPGPPGRMRGLAEDVASLLSPIL